MAKIMIIYHSQEFGNTAKCAELVAQGARSVAGAEVEMVNTNEAQRVDMKALAACDGVAIGSPDYGSYVAGTIKQLFDDMYVAAKTGLVFKGKPCILFMTHGGGGAGIKALKSMARNFRVLAEPFVCQGAPEQCCPDAIAQGSLLAKTVVAL
jgi:multimeric flavodoxin WrbA